MKKLVLAFTLMFITVAICGCTNTVKGLGQDMKNTGERITDAMKEK